jgi:5-enolpyruvylshikimate-3-phosphate synthase
LRGSAPIVIRDCANVATSFPGFVELASTAGASITVEGGSESPDEGGQ